MSSLNTNVAAMTALQTLQQTQSMLETTQSRVATGFRVNEASDNAAYWSIATTMRSDNKALATVQDALGLGQAKVDVAYTGLNAAIDVVDQIKTKLVAAREPGVDRSKIQSEIGELQNQLKSIASSSSFSGTNWLSIDHDVATDGDLKAEIVSSFNRSDDGTVSVGTIELTVSGFALFNTNGDGAGNATDADQVGIIDKSRTGATTVGATAASTTFNLEAFDISAATVTDIDIDNLIKGADAAVQEMTTAAAELGASKSRIEMQADFIGNLMGAIERGISTLVDADMTAESTKLSALQTQQQLGIQALSIANGNAQSILGLFR